MLSKNQIKIINSLNKKKFRSKHRLFIAEGIKTVKEMLASNFEMEALYTTADILFAPAEKLHVITEKELKKISQLSTPQTVLAVFKIPSQKITQTPKLTVVLDGVRDPGNLGTIIRLCDWFGIEQLVCSKDTVDCYNPKTVQATMGSLSRVRVIYTDLVSFLSENTRPVFGTFMDGAPIYDLELPQKGIVVLGNEAHGISKPVEEMVGSKIAIPQFGKQKSTESLNVATATAIVLNEFKRGEKN